MNDENNIISYRNKFKGRQEQNFYEQFFFTLEHIEVQKRTNYILLGTVQGKFKPKWNISLIFSNNILSYRNKFIKEKNILE